ncbi:MAG TPA: DUF3341 domain-containing protein [Pseudolabrys sp.]|nr:DUF3341 domain-containing protein [Pseudolabrys sp.]
MTDIVLAQFSNPETLLNSARSAREARLPVLDAFTPFAVDGLAEVIGVAASHVRVAMFIGGIAIAALAYGTEWYSAVLDYPINSGGRPLHAWPAFMLFPFAVGILGAAVAGLAALFVQGRLPHLNHELFDVPGFERVSQDAFLLAFAAQKPAEDGRNLRDWLSEAGAVAIWEINK